MPTKIEFSKDADSSRPLFVTESPAEAAKQLDEGFAQLTPASGAPPTIYVNGTHVVSVSESAD